MPSITLSRFQSEVFNENGNWVCPNGVTQVLVHGCGGGGGGGGGGSSFSASGGNGAPVKTAVLSVVPGTTYAVTIGAGGAGNAGASGSGVSATSKTAGNPSYFGAEEFPGAETGSLPTGTDSEQDSIYASAGTTGPMSGGFPGGGGGGASLGAGGNGGNRGSGGTNTVGAAAAANSGAGGGGGGGGAADPGTGKAGGNGGSGRITVYWVETKASM
jgi:hypothetical protein